MWDLSGQSPTQQIVISVAAVCERIDRTINRSPIFAFFTLAAAQHLDEFRADDGTLRAAFLDGYRKLRFACGSVSVVVRQRIRAIDFASTGPTLKDVVPRAGHSG